MEPRHFEELYPEKTRFEELKKVAEALKAGRSAQVIGLPGVGKGNVLRLFPYNRIVRTQHFGEDESRFHFVYMDFAEVRQRNPFEIIKFILISLSYSLGERSFKEEQEAVNGFLKEALDFQDELIFFQGLKKAVDYLALDRGLHIVLLFDRFEDYLPDIDDKFFLNLKILRNRVKYNFTAVFAVTRPIEDILEISFFGEFHEFLVGNNVFLPIMDKTGLDFRFSYIEKITGKKENEQAKQEIVRLTGGHGKLARLAYEAALSEGAKDMENLFLSKSQIRGGLFEIWNFLLPSERKTIKAGGQDEFLEKIGLSAKSKITIPLFASFIKTLADESSQDKLKFDPERNEINKGEENLTDKLSPSEFKLLRFLLENQGRICEKDEIINNVWKDSQTQEGVTDQALDQIIYRLRKKIEPDPNNPKVLQTIKGRGYKIAE